MDKIECSSGHKKECSTDISYGKSWKHFKWKKTYTKAICICMIYVKFMWNFQNRQIQRQKINSYFPEDEETRKCELTVSGISFLFGVMKMFGVSGNGFTRLWTLISTELYTLKEQILWYVIYISIFETSFLTNKLG